MLLVHSVCCDLDGSFQIESLRQNRICNGKKLYYSVLPGGENKNMPFFALLGCVADLVIFTIVCGGIGLLAVTFGPTLTPIIGPVLTLFGI